MAQKYDKVIKENLEKIVLRLISKLTDIEPIDSVTLYPALHYTIEREADFISMVYLKENRSIIFHIEFQMYIHSALIYQQYRLPIRQIVFYIGKAVMNMTTSLVMPQFIFQYQ